MIGNCRKISDIFWLVYFSDCTGPKASIQPVAPAFFHAHSKKYHTQSVFLIFLQFLILCKNGDALLNYIGLFMMGKPA